MRNRHQLTSAASRLSYSAVSRGWNKTPPSDATGTNFERDYLGSRTPDHRAQGASQQQINRPRRLLLLDARQRSAAAASPTLDGCGLSPDAVAVAYWTVGTRQLVL